MLYGTTPFKGSGIKELQGQILSCDYELKEEVSEEARDLIQKLLCRDPTERLTLSQVLKHPWLSKVESKSKSNADDDCSGHF